jgi:hypothetical protein
MAEILRSKLLKTGVKMTLKLPKMRNE